MNICTIITAGWVDKHLIRWKRYADKNLPTWKKYLIYAEDWIGDAESWVKDSFDGVKVIGAGQRDLWNRCRMGATTLFGLDEVVYCDADADILAPLELQDIMGDATMGFVKSPAKHGDWVNICDKRGWPSWEANNGFLYLKCDWTEEYDKAVESVKAECTSDRISGTMAFNWMLRNSEGWTELPYENSMIWWDVNNIIGARVVQYCNDQGQAKRLVLEREWRDCNGL